MDPSTGLLTFNQEGNDNAAKTESSIHIGLGGGFLKGGPDRNTGRALDLASFQHFYRSRADFLHAPAEQSAAADVLLALTRFDPLLDELAQAAASYTQARFPVNYTQRPASMISLPHYNLVQQLVSLLRLRACALLAASQADPALHDITLALRLQRAIASEPTLLGSAVDATCIRSLMQPIWEGLQARRWSAAQLTQLQAMLSGVDELAAYRRNAQAERASSLLPVLDELREDKNLNNVAATTKAIREGNALPPGLSFIYRLYPRGWCDEGKAVVSRLDQRYVIDTIDVARHRIDARQCDIGIAVINGLPTNLRTVVAKMELPMYDSFLERIAYTQTIVDQAVLACALEHHYLDRSSYPSSLEALAPVYLGHVPTDVIDGAPLHYELTSDGRYRLWSVGWDGLDEHGKIVWAKNTASIDSSRGDWVWQYAVPPLPSDSPRGK